MQHNRSGGAAHSWRKLKLIATNGETATGRPEENKNSNVCFEKLFLVKIALINDNGSKV